MQRKFSIEMSSLGFLNCFIRNRFLLVKLALLGLLLYGAVLFLFQRHELMERVRQLESEKMLWKKEKEIAKHLPSTIEENKGKEILIAKSSDEIQIDYSQKKYYPFIYNLPNKCKDENGSPVPVFLLVVIKSITAQFDRRQSIRVTWGDENQIPGVSIKRIFLLARSNDLHKEALLAEEAAEYQDIVQGDFVDSFRNLTVKDIMFLRYMITNCGQTKYIFKGDDDVFVNIRNIIDYLYSLPKEKSANLFAGSVLYPSPRITDPKSKYYVSSNLWKEKYYPPYVSGGGFVMSSLIAKKIFEVIKVTPIIPIDDAFMGVCLKKLGVKPQDHKGFKSWGVNRPKDICLYRDIMTLHKLNSEELRQRWTELHQSNFTDCAVNLSDLKEQKTKLTLTTAT